MSVSKALENSAKAFCEKYACSFDFESFEARVEEFTFFRPNGGWVDAYKTVFERMYRQALEAAAEGTNVGLDGEAMIDDFEYTLIRPYVSEAEGEIRHKPYVGMDRLARLEYLGNLTEKAPSNPVELYIEKYKRGELSVRKMRRLTSRTRENEVAERKRCVQIAGYVRALEAVNEGRSFLWRALHPFRNNAEKRDAAMMRRMLAEKKNGGAGEYAELVKAAYEPFEGYKRVNAGLSSNKAHAMEELNRRLKMNAAMKEAFGVGTSAVSAAASHLCM